MTSVANIETGIDNLPEWLVESILDIYVPMVEEMIPKMAEAAITSKYPEKLPRLRAKYIDEMNWEIYAVPYGDDKYDLYVEGPGVEIQRRINLKDGVLEHGLFELSYKLQGKGLAQHVMNASVKLASKAGVSNIRLGANLDVGGYAWLRKGFFPEGGVNKLLVIGAQSDHRDLYQEFGTLLKGMSEQDVRSYVLSDDFRRFKDLFLESSWMGDLDINNDISRTALTQGAEKAYALAKRENATPMRQTDMTYNEKIRDGMVRHQTYLMRYARGITLDSAKLLKATEKRVRAAVLAYAEEYEGLNPTSKQAQKLFKELQAEVTELRMEAWAKIQEEVPEQFAGLAAIEAAAMIKIIEAPFPISLGLQPLSARHLNAIAKTRPFEGELLSAWLKGSADADVSRIVRNAKNGMVEGLTPSQVARAAMGTPGLDYKDGQARKAFQQLESLYLTVTNGIGNQVKQDLYAANSDIIEEEYYVATLDIRTTKQCASLDGKTFPRGKGPIPPLHFRCRSLRIPYLNPEVLNKRGFDASSNREFLDKFAEENGLGTIKSYKDLPRGYKGAYNTWARKETRRKVGQVPATQTFDTFLRNQTDAFQNEYLGVAKANIFRQGNLKLSQFVTTDGYELTIADLNKLSKAA